ncbi:hypothetical protein Tco_1560365, partial [Tanacetum coccineum]
MVFKNLRAQNLSICSFGAKFGAHGDSNSNNAAVGEEARAIAALIQ